MANHSSPERLKIFLAKIINSPTFLIWEKIGKRCFLDWLQTMPKLND